MSDLLFCAAALGAARGGARAGSSRRSNWVAFRKALALYTQGKQTSARPNVICSGGVCAKGHVEYEKERDWQSRIAETCRRRSEGG
jgi:hypothetical protein